MTIYAKALIVDAILLAVLTVIAIKQRKIK